MILRIRELRRAHKPEQLSQERLAALAGVSLETLRRAELRGTVRMRTLEKIAGALEVPVEELFAPGEKAS